MPLFPPSPTNAYEPWLVSIPNTTEPSAMVGTWDFADFLSEAPAYASALSLTNLTNTQNEYIEWPVVLSVGTWKLQWFSRKSTNVGIYTVSLDGVTVGTQDGYAAAIAAVALSISDIAVATAGKKLLRFTMATKNASSSSYAAHFFGISLRRTA